MAPSNLSPELPLELLYEIIKFLPLKDLQTFCLASWLTRSLAIPFIFGHLRYTGDVLRKVHKIRQARKDVKAVIKKLELHMSDYSTLSKKGSLVIFLFLETLPNLQVLDVENLSSEYLSEFISSIRHTTLLELALDNTFDPPKGPPIAGLAGLQKLSISWYTSNIGNELGSSLARLYELIRPTLTTLVELRIDIMHAGLGDFDLHILKPSADTLRTFEYTLRSEDENILDTIPTILPHLIKLSIKWDNSYTNCSILWKDSHIQALSKNDNLTDLKLPLDFEVNARDTPISYDDYACFVRCYKRRLKATQDIVLVCPRLQRCSWVQMRHYSEIVSHSFIVEERMTGGKLTRVVRGIKQHWMGRDYNDRYRGGGIVKCKLEDLPGDIIGQNDIE